MRIFIFIYGLIAARIWLIDASACCPSCECHRVCQTPDITADMTMEGLNIICNKADCACVKDELDGCTYGGVWSNMTVIGWGDSRWGDCIKVTRNEPFRASAILRWWDNSIMCMGHSILNIETNVIGIYRDVFVQFEQTVSYQHGENINNVFYVTAVSGSNDSRPVVGQSMMYFYVEIKPVPGAHIEILNCSVQTTAGPDGEVLTENHITLNGTQGGNIQGQLNSNKTRMTYTAFWDDVSNSPFHNLMCDYAIFNGTAVSTYPSQRKYMIADPNEDAVLWDDTTVGNYVEDGVHSGGRRQLLSVSSTIHIEKNTLAIDQYGLRTVHHDSGGRCDNTSDLKLTIIQHDSHYSPFRRIEVEPNIKWNFGGEYTSPVERIGRFKNGRWYEGEDPMQVGMYVLFAWCLGIIFLVVMRNNNNSWQFRSEQHQGRRNRVFTSNKLYSYE